MSDLVKRLRESPYDRFDPRKDQELEAADRIEALEAALREIADAFDKAIYGPRAPPHLNPGEVAMLMKYFVLKPSGDDIYAKASRMAMMKYADIITKDNPEFALQLRDWSDHENALAYSRSVQAPQDSAEQDK